MARQALILCPDVGDQNRNNIVQISKGFYCSSLLQQLLGHLRQLAAITVVKLLVGGIVGIFALGLQPLLIAKMLHHIVVQEADRLLNLIPASSL